MQEQSIGQQIRAERKLRNMTVDELGLMFGRDRQAIYLWENDRVTPSGEAMLRLIQHGFVTVPSNEDAA